jgi:glucose-specific phosphotransferase system IIA component
MEILWALGGKTNIQTIDACITRLRLNVKDPALIQKDKLKSLGAAGVMQNGQNVQAVFGVESDRIKEEIKALLDKNYFASPIKGEILSLETVPDETFSQKVLGDGFAIRPQEGAVYAPFDGKVVTLFPTQHALGLETQNGLELLIHVGIDTVQMKGQGFKAFVKEGDSIKAGTKLLEFDLDLVRKNAKSDITPIVITNLPKEFGEIEWKQR